MHLFRFAVAVAAALVAMPLDGRASPPLLGPDTAVDFPVRTAPALLDQHSSAIAYGGGTWLTVWIERGTSSLYAARSDGRGAVIDDPPLTIAQLANVDFPAVAFDGKRFLVTWVTPIGMGDVDGAYVDPATGAVGAPFHVVAKPLSQDNQAMAGGLDGNGGAWSLVAWVDATVSPRRIHAAVLDGSGAFAKDAAGKPLADVTLSTNMLLPSNAPLDATPPAVAWNGSAFLVAWTEGTPSFAAVMAATISTAGAIAGPYRVDSAGSHTITVNDAMGGQHMVSVPIALTEYPTAASDGNQFLVAWSDERDNPPPNNGIDYLYARLVGASGPAGASDFQVAMPAATTALRSQATFAGGDYLLAWEDVDTSGNVVDALLWAARIGATGTLLDGPGAAVTSVTAGLNEFRRSTFASDGKRAVLAWDSDPPRFSHGLTGQDVFLTPIDPSAPPQVVPPLLVDREANLQRAHAVATNGAVFLLVWEDDRDFATTGIDLWGLRVDPSGKPVDVDSSGHPAPFVICNQPGDQILPAVAAWSDGGGDFLVAWSDGRGVSPDESSGAMQIYGARVGSMGAPVDAGGFLISTNPGAGRLAPTVAASNGRGWLVAWEDWRNQTTVAPYVFAEVWAATVAAGGMPGPEQQVTKADPMNPTTIACAPSAAWDGARYFVAYEQPCSQYPAGAIPDMTGATAKSHLFGDWFDAANAVEAATPVTLALTTTLDEKAVQLAALPGGGSIAIAWRSSKPGGNDEIRVAAIADHATAPGASRAVDGSGSGVREAPAIATSAASGGALVTWIDTAPAGSAMPGAVALRLDGTLAPVDAAPFDLAAGPNAGVFRVPTPPDGSLDNYGSGAEVAALPRTTPTAALAALPTGEALAAWSFVEQLAARPVPRMHFLALGLGPRGGSCTEAAQCADGICTGRGVCCDTACDGVCRTCTANGCVGVPETDDRCGGGSTGTISCAALSTTCRRYRDLPVHACATFGACAEPGDLAECTAFAAAPDGTACATTACPNGVASSCRSGECECGAPPTPPSLGAWALPGCAVARRPTATGPLPLLALALAALALRRRSRKEP